MIHCSYECVPFSSILIHFLLFSGSFNETVVVETGNLNGLIKHVTESPSLLNILSSECDFWHQNDTVGHTSKRRIFFSWLDCTIGSRPLQLNFVITLRHTTRSKTPLDEWSARHRDFYLTTHITHKRKTSMFLSEFNPAISGSDRPQTHAFICSVTGIDTKAEIITAKGPLNEFLADAVYAVNVNCTLSLF